MSEQDKADIQNAKQFVLAAIDLIGSNSFGHFPMSDRREIRKRCRNAAKLLGDVEERNS